MGRQPRDRVRAEVRRLLTAGVSGQVFPGGSACVSFRSAGAQAGGEQLVSACAGTLARGEAAVQENTRYDLGAITQAFVAAAALRMAARGALDLSVTAESVLPDVRGGALGETTLLTLLRHRSNLAAWGGLYLDVPHELGSTAARRWVVSEAGRRVGGSAGRPEASDLGYIVAGEAMARVAGCGLDEVVTREVLAPLGLDEEVLYMGALSTERRAALIAHVAPSERCEWRGRLVRGDVHDENAYALGGVAGNAGLFATAQALALFGRAILDSLAGRSDFLAAPVVQDALAAADGAPTRLGWVMKSGTGASAGRRLGARTFGQLGITGTSIFCDPDRDVVVVLLTNRICPSRANEKIDGFRPAFHDGVLAALG